MQIQIETNTDYQEHTAFKLVDFHETRIITAVYSIYKIVGEKVNTCTYCGTGYYTDNVGTTSVSYCHTICGDGLRVDATEQCDDGNSGGDDGCNSACQIERGYQCIGGSLTSPDICTPICGEGTRISPETCDDGNLINGDGCDSTCKVETYMRCTGGSKTSKDTCGAICGDGHRINGYEICDDNNLENDDGCSSTCNIESGFRCSGGSYTSADTCVPICGDGLRVKGEDCDDGNLISSDGCSSLCKVEYGYECKGGSKTSADSCTEICGDGISIVKNGTTCDDGNKNNYDGCSQDCLIEKDWTCSGGNITTKDTCTEISSGFASSTAATTQGSSGLTVFLTILSTLLSNSSPFAIWAMNKQLQLLLLVVLISCYIPASVLQYLIGVKFSLFNFSFIPIEKLKIVSDINSYLDVEQTNYRYSRIGFDSQLSIRNNLSLLFALVLTVIFHVCFLITFPPCKVYEDSSKARRFFSRIRTKIVNAFTLNVYIRTGIESFQFFLISSCIELLQSDTSNGIRTASFIFAIALFAFTYWYIILSIIVVRFKIDPKVHSVVDEFFVGLKHTKISKLYTSIQLLRKFFLIITLMLLSFTGYFIVVVVCGIIQLIFLVYIIIVRPFESKRDMIIEILNEIFFFFILCWMTHYNTYERWSDSIVFVFVTVLMCNNLIILIIVSILSIKSFCEWNKNRKLKKVKNRKVHVKVESRSWRMREPPLTPRETENSKMRKSTAAQFSSNINESNINLKL